VKCWFLTSDLGVLHPDGYEDPPKTSTGKVQKHVLRKRAQALFASG